MGVLISLLPLLVSTPFWSLSLSHLLIPRIAQTASVLAGLRLLQFCHLYKNHSSPMCIFSCTPELPREPDPFCGWREALAGQLPFFETHLLGLVIAFQLCTSE